MSLAALAAPLLDGLDLETGSRRIGRLVAFEGVMMEATGLDQPIGGGVRVIDADGHATRAEVVGFRGNRVLLMARRPM